MDFLRQLFNERPVLFLGCDLSDPVYEKFLLKFTDNAKVQSYCRKSPLSSTCRLWSHAKSLLESEFV